MTVDAADCGCDDQKSYGKHSTGRTSFRVCLVVIPSLSPLECCCVVGRRSRRVVFRGLPIVILASSFLRGRLASAILDRMELTDQVAKTENDYIDLAVRLAGDSRF